MCPGLPIVLPLPANGVHRVEVRVSFNEAPGLLLRKLHGVLEQLCVRVVDELNHLLYREHNYK